MFVKKKDWNKFEEEVNQLKESCKIMRDELDYFIFKDTHKDGCSIERSTVHSGYASSIPWLHSPDFYRWCDSATCTLTLSYIDNRKKRLISKKLAKINAFRIGDSEEVSWDNDSILSVSIVYNKVKYVLKYNTECCRIDKVIVDGIELPGLLIDKTDGSLLLQ
jgi:hypothetical protein